MFTKSRDIKEHLVALDRVLQRCLKHNLYVKLSKCVFCAPTIPCLGDIVGRDGVQMDPDKAAVIKDWPVPRTKLHLQSFLGTCVYVLRFCPDFAEIAAPLTELTKHRAKNDVLPWSDVHQRAFELLKERLSAPPILAHPDFSLDFHVKMDASDFAVGGYLFQLDKEGHERIIAYGGRKMTREELAYPTREKELLAALHGMRLWRVYLIDKPFYINTDHHTLASILTQTTCSQRLARWLNELSLFQPRFKWIPGSTNVVADSISRNPDWNDGTARTISLLELIQSLQRPTDRLEEEALFFLYVITRGSIPRQCVSFYEDDGYFGPIVKELQSLQSAELPSRLKNFMLKDKLLYFRINHVSDWRLCIPSNEDLRNQVLHECHDVITSGHPGETKTFLAVSERYYWRGMAKFVRRYVSSCEKCQRNKYVRGRPVGHLNPLDVPSSRWSDISMDFMVKLPRTNGTDYDAIMVIVDRLSKRAHFIPTFTTATAESTARLFVAQYQRLHGLPLSITSDRDSKFTSKFWESVMKLQQTSLKVSTAFKPSTDGQAEVTNKFIIEFLRHFIGPHQTDWDQHLPFAEFAYNSRKHSSIEKSPFEVDIGYNPRSVADLQLDPLLATSKEAVSFVERQKAILCEAQEAMVKAQVVMSEYYNKNRPHVKFNVGDEVLLNTSNLDLAHIGTTGKRKFAAPFIDPYPIEAIVGTDRYRLKLPPGLRLHPEFAISKLKRYVHDSNPSRQNRLPALITANQSHI